MSAVPEGLGDGDLVTPDDRSGIERGDEQVAQNCPVDLGTPTLAFFWRIVDKDRTAFVEDAHGLTLWVRETAKLFVEAGCAKGELSRLLVHVERPALLAGVGGSIKFVDGGGDAMYLKDARENETAQARSDDGDTWL